MFFTVNETRLPFPSIGEGVSAWDLVEVPLCAPFFMLGASSIFPNGKTVQSAYFISSFHQLSEFISSPGPVKRNINFVYLMCPQHMSGGAPWEMHHLAKLYQAQEPTQTEFNCQIYESFDGKKFIDSFLDTSIDDLGELTTLHTFHR